MKAKQQRMLTWIAYAALAVGAMFLLFRFLLPWLAPFLLAFLTAHLIEPIVRFLMKRGKLQRGFACVVCSILVLALMITMVGFLIGRLLSGISSFVQNLPDLVGQMSYGFSQMDGAIHRFVIAAPVETQDIIQSAIDGFTAMVTELPAALSTRLLGVVASMATGFPRLFLFTITYAIGVLFISIGYPQVTAFIRRQIPDKWRERARTLRQDIAQTMIKWCRAQVMLIGVTFVLLTISFLILRIPYALLLAVLIAIIDALPVLGTGTVLIPWAILSALGGDVTLGVGLGITYGLVSITHSFMEPRLVGGQLGLHPVATLMAMYIGFASVGVVGMITFPFLLILLKQFHDRGHLRLWK